MLIYVSNLQTLGWIPTKERGLRIQGVWRKQIRKQEQVDTGLEEGREVEERQGERERHGKGKGAGQERSSSSISGAAGPGAGHLHGGNQDRAGQTVR